MGLRGGRCSSSGRCRGLGRGTSLGGAGEESQLVIRKHRINVCTYESGILQTGDYLWRQAAGEMRMGGGSGILIAERGMVFRHLSYLLTRYVKERNGEKAACITMCCLSTSNWPTTE